MKKILLKTALATLFFSIGQSANTLKAQDVTYLISDKLCINKYDYHITQGKGNDFYDFHLILSNTEKLILRVPKTDNVHIAKFKTLDPNAQYIKCSELEKVTADFVEKVNGNSQHPLYVVENNANEGGYIAYHVNEIISVKEGDAQLVYKDKRYDFSVDKRAQYDKNTNLNKTNLSVKLQQKGKEQCFETYTFLASVINATEAAQEIQFLSGVGMSKIKSSHGLIELKTINGALLSTYLTNMCNVQAGIKTPLSDKSSSTLATTPKDKPSSTENPPTQHKSRGLFDKPATQTPKDNTSPSSNTANAATTNTTPASTANTVPAGTQSRGLKPKNTALPMPKEVPPGFHLVKEGDNLYKIAQEYAITVNHIKYWNNLQSDALQVNQLLKVVDDGYNTYKGQNPTYREVDSRRFIIHKVEQNETLGGIAKKYRTSMQNLFQWNKLENDFLQIGQELIVGEEQL